MVFVKQVRSKNAVEFITRRDITEFHAGEAVGGKLAPRHHSYYVEGEPMRRVTEVRDLGVWFTADLNFRAHITELCKKSYRNLGFILRQSQGFTNLGALRALYEALVRSHLEHNSVKWAPSEIKYIKMVEQIQNRFVRHLYMRMYGIYPGYPLLYPTLFVVGMVGYSTLETRRQVTITKYLLMVLRGKRDHPAILEELKLCAPDNSAERRRRPQLLALPHARTNLLRCAPLTRALRTLNSVADRVDLFNCTLDEFTSAISNIVP